ncbi:putative non-specific serine/threonine protein kinase [Helianthus anomalus]
MRPYGICRINIVPACSFIGGFEPRVPKEWSRADWSSGCRRQINVTPETEYNFTMYSNLKLPDSRISWFNRSISHEECENVCASSVSCTTFSNTNIIGGKSGCLTWFGELMDIREAPQGDVSGQDIYIKMANLKVIRMCICDFLESMCHVSSGYSNIL